MTPYHKQRTNHDCGICCLVMLSGMRYERVIELAGDEFTPGPGLKNPPGLRSHETVLERMGYKNTYKNGEPADDCDFVSYYRPWCLTGALYRNFIWGRKALLCVPSLNIEGGSHMIYYDGREIHDPSTKKTYTKLSECEPTEVTIFRVGI